LNVAAALAGEAKQRIPAMSEARDWRSHFVALMGELDELPAASGDQVRPLFCSV